MVSVSGWNQNSGFRRSLLLTVLMMLNSSRMTPMLNSLILKMLRKLLFLLTYPRNLKYSMKDALNNIFIIIKFSLFLLFFGSYLFLFCSFYWLLAFVNSLSRFCIPFYPLLIPNQFDKLRTGFSLFRNMAHDVGTLFSWTRLESQIGRPLDYDLQQRGQTLCFELLAA